MATLETTSPDELRKMIRKVGYAFWRQNHLSSTPDATAEDVQKAWLEVREDQVKIARRAIAALEKNGYKITAT